MELVHHSTFLLWASSRTGFQFCVSSWARGANFGDCVGKGSTTNRVTSVTSTILIISVGCGDLVPSATGS